MGFGAQCPGILQDIALSTNPSRKLNVLVQERGAVKPPRMGGGPGTEDVCVYRKQTHT